jgi:hypothetical protein
VIDEYAACDDRNHDIEKLRLASNNRANIHQKIMNRRLTVEEYIQLTLLAGKELETQEKLNAAISSLRS